MAGRGAVVTRAGWQTHSVNLRVECTLSAARPLVTALVAATTVLVFDVLSEVQLPHPLHRGLGRVEGVEQCEQVKPIHDRDAEPSGVTDTHGVVAVSLGVIAERYGGLVARLPASATHDVFVATVAMCKPGASARYGASQVVHSVTPSASAAALASFT